MPIKRKRVVEWDDDYADDPDYGGDFRVAHDHDPGLEENRNDNLRRDALERMRKLQNLRDRQAMKRLHNARLGDKTMNVIAEIRGRIDKQKVGVAATTRPPSPADVTIERLRFGTLEHIRRMKPRPKDIKHPLHYPESGLDISMDDLIMMLPPGISSTIKKR